MTYNGKTVEVLSMDDKTAVIRDAEGLKCVGVSDLKEEKTKKEQAGEPKIPQGKAKK